jgi:hypothetical protein
MKIVINVEHTVHGNNNVIPTSPSALADTTKSSAILPSTVTQFTQC